MSREDKAPPGADRTDPAEPRPRSFHGWDARYREQPVEQMPWFHPHLDADVDTALTHPGIAAGRALDIGTGPGTHAIALAQRGFAVTATDLSPTAVAEHPSAPAPRVRRSTSSRTTSSRPA